MLEPNNGASVNGPRLLTSSDSLDHFDAASVADLDRGEGKGPVEGVAAVRIRVAVALEAL